MKHLLTALIVCLSILFIALQFIGLEFQASGVRALMLSGILLLYLYAVDNKRIYYLIFLIIFTLAEWLHYYSWFDKNDYTNTTNYLYFTGNILSMISYGCLIIQVLSTMKFKKMVRKLPLHIFILLLLGAFCVYMISSTMISSTTGKTLSSSEYMLEFIYNAVLMTLLSVALLDFIYRDDKKAMNFLLGSLFIVFAEVIQLAYFYVADFNVLNMVYSIFFVLAFFFFFIQSRIIREPAKMNAILEVEELGLLEISPFSEES